MLLWELLFRYQYPSGSDTGSAVDAASLLVYASGDAGQSVTSGAVSASIPGTDAGHAVDSGSVSATLSGVDAGHGADFGAVSSGGTNLLAASDLSSVVDQAVLLIVSGSDGVTAPEVLPRQHAKKAKQRPLPQQPKIEVVSTTREEIEANDLGFAEESADLCIGYFALDSASGVDFAFIKRSRPITSLCGDDGGNVLDQASQSAELLGADAFCGRDDALGFGFVQGVERSRAGDMGRIVRSTPPPAPSPSPPPPPAPIVVECERVLVVESAGMVSCAGSMDHGVVGDFARVKNLGQDPVLRQEALLALFGVGAIDDAELLALLST